MNLSQLRKLNFLLEKVNVKSAPSHDEIKVPYLQNVPCSEFLCKLFNKCLELGESPLPWMCSIIKPIPKPGGNPLNPSDYRGISLQSCVTKILCFVMRLTEYVEDNVLLAEEQNGFRSNRNCQDHIYSLYNIVHGRKLLKKHTFAVFIDFRKAFESVPRSLLWNKPQSQFGLRGPFLDLLKSL